MLRQSETVIDHTWAENTWTAFYNKFNVSLLKGVMVFPTNDNNNNNNNHSRITSDGEFIYVDPALGNHDFRTFVGRQNEKVLISRNQTKIAALKKAIDDINQGKDAFHAEIFYDETLPYVALALYFDQQIDRQQITTILEAWQTAKDYPIEGFYRILDDNNNFTEEAEKLLLPAINNHKLKKISEKEQIEKFRLLVAACPRSEQIFYTSDIGRLRQSLHGEIIAKDNYFFANKLIDLGSLYIHYHNDNKSLSNASLLHVSSSVHDALGLTRYGDEYVRPISRLGKFTMDDIEEGVFNGIRLSALSYPGVKAFGHDIHGWEDIHSKEATAHDKNYHVDVMSTSPKPFIAVFKYIVSLARKHLPHHTSREIWDMIDLDYTHFFNNHDKFKGLDQKNIEQMTKAFGGFLSDRSFSSPSPFITTTTFGMGHPTLLGLLLILDMVKQPDFWKKEFKIDPEQLKRPYSDFYGMLEYIMPFIKDDPIEIQLLKCQIRLLTDYNRLEKLNPLINEFQEEISQKINVIKLNYEIQKSNPKLFSQLEKEYMNTLHLTFDDAIITGSLVKELEEQYTKRKELLEFCRFFKSGKPEGMDDEAYKNALVIVKQYEENAAKSQQTQK